MNAQTNSTNFQQFVNSNKGKLITFKHNDTLVSKVVVDVCGEYFTGKINESDAKIDGFYYFSDCKMVDSKHPVIEVLEKYRFVILRQLDTGADFMIEYISNNGDRFNAKNLAIRYNNSFLSTKLMDIGEVWAIVDGKYTSVWKTADTIARDGDSKYGALEKVLKENKGCNVATKSGTWCNFNFHSLNGVVVGDSGITLTPTAIMASNIVSVDSKDGKRVYTSDEILPEPSQPMDKLTSYFDSHNKVSNACEKVINTLDNLNKAFDKVFPKELFQNSSDIDEEQYNLIKEHAKMFIDIFYDLGGYAPNTINKFLNKLLFIKEREFSLEELKEFRASFEELRDELLPQIKNTFKKDPTFQALLKRFVEFSLLILTESSIHKDNIKTLLININNNMSVAGKKEYIEWFKKENKQNEKNIKYRGKPKTVVVMNEFKHANGKDYVMVKDVTDNDKTKTLFKEYIEWM